MARREQELRVACHTLNELADPARLAAELEAGESEANERAAETVRRMASAMGLSG